MSKSEEYVIIPGTQQRVYDGSVVMLYRLPNLRWIIHYGYYNYNGRKQKGWYFSSIPADTTMPVFNEDLVAMKVIDSPCPPPPPGPYPPGPCPPPPYPPGPVPPAPVPIPFTPQDKMQVEAAMLTVNDLYDRDKLGRDGLQDGKIVRVNDTDGHGTVEYYSWNAKTSMWEEASLGYRYMTRDEILEAVADDIVSIVWSNENGALVLTNNAGTPLDPVHLLGVSHDPIYVEEDLTLTIPVYGKDPLVMTIPKDHYIRSLRFESNWAFDTKIAPALVITVSDGVTDEEIAGDISGVRGMFHGVNSDTINLRLNSDNGNIIARVRLSSIANNPLKVDNEGMWVDLSGVVGKKQIETGFLLVADGNGEFTYAGNGVGLEQTTALDHLTNPEKKVVTANLIIDAISAAISALEIALEGKIADLETRVGVLEEKLDFDAGEAPNGTVLVTNGDKIRTSSYQIGGGILDTESETTVATEEAVTRAMSWIIL